MEPVRKGFVRDTIATIVHWKERFIYFLDPLWQRKFANVINAIYCCLINNNKQGDITGEHRNVQTNVVNYY